MSSKINELKTKFDSVSNVGKFVNENSDIKFDSTYLAKKDLPLEFQEQLFNLPAGSVFESYVHNGHQCLSRMIGRKANATAKASHILLAYKGLLNLLQQELKKAQALAKFIISSSKSKS